MADYATAMARISGHRASIREHITKYKTYTSQYDKDFALKTIYRVQDEIRREKSNCSRSIESSYEDSWNHNYDYSTKESLIAIRELLIAQSKSEELEITESQSFSM